MVQGYGNALKGLLKSLRKPKPGILFIIMETDVFNLNYS